MAPAHVRELSENVLRGSGRPGFSQAWQDWLLYRNFFAGQRTGLYVDIGTNDAVKISNTVFFDVCLGWTGVCYEPQKAYHRAIHHPQPPSPPAQSPVQKSSHARTRPQSPMSTVCRSLAGETHAATHALRAATLAPQPHSVR